MCDTSKAVRESKHIAIVESINRLSSRITSLESLLGNIGGIPSDVPDKPTEVNPCLREFLDRTEGELDLLSDRLSKITEELNSSLF